MQRCSNPNSHNWELYGGRGIRVCEAWKDFGNFKAWAEASGYADNLTIERVNPDGDYDPSNCEWVTRSVNSWRAKHPGQFWRSLTCNA